MEKTENKKLRDIESICEKIKKNKNKIEYISKGKIEIHFAGDNISMSITEFC
jgi:hypothetical protein